MPSITIRERDLTSAGNLEATTNTVYIPGYANMGPTNEPILCETLQDFQLIFGSEPYKFRKAQPWPADNRIKDNRVTLDDGTKVGFPYGTNSAVDSSMANFYEAGEFEKSYIMAAEILKLGIPVLYERLVAKDDVATWTAQVKLKIDSATGSINDGLTVKASSSGFASSKIAFTMSKLESKIDKDSSGNNILGNYFLTTVWRDADIDLGISKIAPSTTKFTFNPKLASLYNDIILVYPGKKFKDNSGLVIFEFDSNLVLDANSSINNYADPAIHNLTFTTSSTIYDQNGKLNDEFTVESMYKALAETGTDSNTGELLGLNKLLDKGEYVIKFITSGAYPVFEFNNNSIAQAIVEVAANRGDCTALIDHTPNNERTLLALVENSVYAKVTDWADTYVVNSLGEDAFTYGAMFTPYGVYNCTTVGKQVMLPASHGYLSALAASVQTNGNWMAAAGVQRGAVPNLVALSQNLTNAIADSYEPRDGIAINPITNIKPYGLTIWGNRTLKNNAKAGDLTATSFLSIRQLTNDVKRTVWVAAKTLTFEQNSDLLWINFKSKIIPTLDQMVSGSGLSGYEIKKQKTTKKATVKAVIRLYAIEPVEDWDITIELADSSTEIAG